MQQVLFRGRLVRLLRTCSAAGASFPGSVSVRENSSSSVLCGPEALLHARPFAATPPGLPVEPEEKPVQEPHQTGP